MHTLTAAGVVLAAGLTAAPALAAANGPKVSVRVEGLSSTVLPARVIDLPRSGSITKGGVTPGACPAASAQGALAVATHGDWTGKWYASYHEYEITGIRGNSPNAKKDYYEIFLNNKPASTGACELKLKAGDQLLFAVVPSSGKPETPLQVSTVLRGGQVRATVQSVSASGRHSPVAGARVSLGGVSGSDSARTNAQGVASFSLPSRPGNTTLVASAPGHIRAEATIYTVS